jgi:hypothetical protein
MRHPKHLETKLMSEESTSCLAQHPHSSAIMPELSPQVIMTGTRVAYCRDLLPTVVAAKSACAWQPIHYVWPLLRSQGNTLLEAAPVQQHWRRRKLSYSAS